MNFIQIIIIVSSVSFVFYSIRSFFSEKMTIEYSRWGYSRHRYKIAISQFFGGIGLLIGFKNIFVLAIVSCLLMTMMFFAIIVRIKVNDSFFQTIPAIFYFILNFIIFFTTLLKINKVLFQY